MIKRFSKLRKVIETDTEIIIQGHGGIVDLDDERFSKSEYKVVITDKFIEIHKL